jgi:DNA-directed RNA polymerase specialized sigma24 family protein
MNEEEQEAYELFRRAIVQRESDAWSAIYARYRTLLVAWANRSARGCSNEWASDIADEALARAWAALTPDRFAEFPSLARLLGYLRACVATTAIDCARSQGACERVTQQLHADTVATPEQIVLADIDRDVLWRTVIALAATPAERVALVETFAYGFPPRTIRERHPQLFSDVTHVYSVKRNLFARLQRNPELLRLCGSLVSLSVCCISALNPF